MTVSSETKRADYVGNGSTQLFATQFRFLQNSDVKVILTVTATGVETVQTEITNYTLSGVGLDAGGTVTMLTAPATGETLTIKRDVSLTQGTDYVENDPFPAESHEDALDKLTMITQQIQEEVDRSLKLTESQQSSGLTVPVPVTDNLLRWDANGNLINVTVQQLGTIADAGDLPYSQGDTGAINSDVEAKLQERLSVKDFGAIGNGTTNDTAAFQLAILASIILKRILFVPSGTYLITDTLNITEGQQIEGECRRQLPSSFGIEPLSSTIDFQPSTSKSLFVTTGTDHANFRLHYSIVGLRLKGNSNALNALDLNGAIYSKFADLAIDGFDTPISCSRTINNRFENIYSDGRVAAVEYVGNNETTDVWTQCTFFGSPIGVDFKGSSITIRFVDCLFEQLNDGVILAKECQSIIFDSCYSEDIVFDNVSTGAMFKVGLTGTTVVVENSLIITGGKYTGRNAGTQGSFISADDTNGIILSGTNVTRFITGIKTTANTRDDSIILGGFQGIGLTTNVDDFSKICGLFPHSNIGDAGAQTRLRLPVMLCQEIRQDTTVGLQVAKTGEKLSFFGVTPVVQPATTGETGGFTAGGGVTATSASTATGNLGTAAYRHSDIVKALKEVGILAL